jgi:hypothetical protein
MDGLITLWKNKPRLYLTPLTNKGGSRGYDDVDTDNDTRDGIGGMKPRI